MKITKSKKTAIVVGSTGLVGKEIVHELINSGLYSKIITLTRREQSFDNSKVQNKVVDFDNLKKYKSLIRGDDLFLAIGTTMAKAGSKSAFLNADFTIPVILANLAFSNDIKQCLVVSSVGADPDSLLFYSRVKGQLETELKTIGFWATHILRPSLLLGKRNESRPAESVGQLLGKGLNLFTGDLLGPYKAIEAQTVAKAMVKLAQKLEPGIYTYPSSVIEKIITS